MLRSLLLSGVFAAVALTAAPARADLAVGAGVSGNFGLGDGEVTLPQSWSVDGLLGFRIKVAALELTPELDLAYLRSNEPERGGGVDWAFQAAVGGRIGLQLGIMVPSAYLHYGLGVLQVTSRDLIRHEKTGPYWEAGGALDFRLADEVSFGIQAGYGSVSLSNLETDLASASVDRLRAGVRLTLFL